MDIFWIFAIVVATVAAITDLRTGKIPNPLTMGALGLAVLAHGVTGAIDGGMARAASASGWAVIGAVACGAFPAFLFTRGAIGGGDVKLLAAMGAICHPARGLAVLTYGFVVAALVVSSRMAYRGELLRTATRALGLVLRRSQHATETGSPAVLVAWFKLGPSILAGVVLAFCVYR